MILVDTSVWIDHFRAADPELARLLEAASALTHPFVIGELALGNFRTRAPIMKMMLRLPRAVAATPHEALDFIEARNLAGSGIGHVDAHLLASTRLTDGATLWTRDNRLLEVATAMGLAASLGGRRPH